MIRKLMMLISLALLAGCGTPQEHCIRGNTREYRILSSLLAQTEANLARGYAWKEREVTRTRLDICQTPVRDRDGGIRYVSYSCWQDDIDIERYRVPIDPAAERRTRDYLQGKLKAESARVQVVIRECKATYPEQG